MARSTMTINTRFSPRVEPFCGEDSLTVFSNVVPEREKKKKGKFSSSCFLRGRGWFKRKRWTLRKIKVLCEQARELTDHLHDFLDV